MYDDIVQMESTVVIRTTVVPYVVHTQKKKKF